MSGGWKIALKISLFTMKFSLRNRNLQCICNMTRWSLTEHSSGMDQCPNIISSKKNCWHIRAIRPLKMNNIFDVDTSQHANNVYCTYKLYERVTQAYIYIRSLTSTRMAAVTGWQKFWKGQCFSGAEPMLIPFCTGYIMKRSVRK